ncbi:hypothetical protein THRCLA_03536 [Thraustotheca clavata]|uniref:Uncharacterized protein n=1 Tax=Thraustotheca clavata TaxID=74557 RepID=A0A1W0A1T0_9STRA|nr:hypothetical protein THRCLA_03536 [Thraustotheca clavata]
MYTEYAAWHRFRDAMSRLTANVMERVATVLLNAPKRPRRVELPQGQVAWQLVQERQEACAFHSIADDLDSEGETDGSEDAFPLNCDMDDDGECGNWREDVQVEAAIIIQRAMRKFWYLQRNGSMQRQSCLYLQRLEYRAACIILHAWQTYQQKCIVHRPLKRKRSESSVHELLWLTHKMREQDDILLAALRVCM